MWWRLPEVSDLAALDDVALVDAAAGWARTENAAAVSGFDLSVAGLR
jgi:hypothetical protein